MAQKPTATKHRPLLEDTKKVLQEAEDSKILENSLVLVLFLYKHVVALASGMTTNTGPNKKKLFFYDGTIRTLFLKDG